MAQAAETMLAQTMGGRMQVRWDEHAQATPHGQLVFFAEFLGMAGVFDRWVEACPLSVRAANPGARREALTSRPLHTYTPSRNSMDAITYTAARANLASTMDRVCNDHEPLIITRNGEQSVVLLSLEDFKSLEETAHLLRSPANAKRLLAAKEQLDAGSGVERKLAK